MSASPRTDLEARRALRRHRASPTRVRIGPLDLGGEAFSVIAGPCAVEGREQIESTASIVSLAGAQGLRGGAFKPRTSPYAFQGMGEPGLRMLHEAGRRFGLTTVAEVMDVSQVPLAMRYADILQVGARNMQNFSLLRALGEVDRPVLLKRGFCATVREWLLAAEYLLAGGNEHVILCERGIRTFEPELRNTLDLSAVALAKRTTHLPVIVDPSHATGERELVTPMSLAAAAAGADGLLLEVHPCPNRALCDGPQALTPEMFCNLMKQLPGILAALGRTLGNPAVGAAVAGR